MTAMMSAAFRLLFSPLAVTPASRRGRAAPSTIRLSGFQVRVSGVAPSLVLAVLLALGFGAISFGVARAAEPPPASGSSPGVQPAPADTADPLMATLKAAGVTDADIGFRPDGTWLRYPDPRSVKFKNRLFDALFADPGKIYPTVTLMARAAERFLEPAYSDTSAMALFKLAYYTGWDLHLSGFRDYGAAMSYRPAEKDPLTDAIGQLWRDSGRMFDFSSDLGAQDWPTMRDLVHAQIAPLDTTLQRILAQAVLDLMEARQWHRRAFRNVNMAEVLQLWNVRDWPSTQSDGSEYFPQIEDIAGSLDEASLITSSRKTVFAAGRLATSLRAWKAAGGKMPHFAPARLVPDPKKVKPEEGKLSAAETRLYTEKDGTRSAERAETELDIWTPAGRIVVAGDGDDVHEERDVLLMVDLGGNDVYREPVGATSSLSLPVSVAVDLSGDDRYEAADEMTPTEGSGIFGTGVLIDLEGKDSYSAGRCSQGFGFFGTGLLADFGGDDTYRIGCEGQGAGFWGVGLLVDRAGNDVYRMDGDGQGFGGIGGVGTLIDYAGNDTYYAEPDSRKVPRPDYTHSMKYINASDGQGAGMGRRGDLTDGHSWAGGMGTLIDLQGDDDYYSGNWSAGAGYWYGMGFLYDKSGNDHYRATTFSLASGAHFCIAAILDDGGNDVYEGLGDARTGMGFGHDFTVSILFDRSGDDVYRFPADGLGEAINTAQAFFVDGGGNDTYVIDAGKSGLGSTNFSPDNWPPPLEANYQARATEIGLFLDLGGHDRYLERDPKTGAETPSSIFKNDMMLLRPADPAAQGDHRHFGIFRDTEGSADALRWFRRQTR